MRIAVLYESLFGSTREAAESIAAGLLAAAPGAAVTCERAADPGQARAGADLLVVGGPTHFLGMTSERSRRMAGEHFEQLVKKGHIRRPPQPWPGPGVREWLAALPPAAGGRRAAAFDTRLGSELFPGSAARLIARGLREHGYEVVIRPEGFLVEAFEGPLCEGERERARAWGAELAGLAAGQVPPVGQAPGTGGGTR